MKERLLPALLVGAMTATAGCAEEPGDFSGLKEAAIATIEEHEWEQEIEQRQRAGRAETTAKIEEYFAGMDHIQPQYQLNEWGVIDGYTITLDVIAENMEPIAPEVAERVRSASVRIDAADEESGGTTYGSGFLLLEKTTGQVKLMTAGHGADNWADHTISAATDAGVPVMVNRFDSYYDADEWSVDDMAVGTLSNAEELRDLALQPRDLEANPLRFGEQLLFTGYHGDRKTGEAIQFSLIYAGEAGGFQAIGDMSPAVLENQTEPGDSGGVITDTSGEVVAINVAHSTTRTSPRLYIECGEAIPIDGNTDLFGFGTLKMFLRVPTTHRECDPGVTDALARPIDRAGAFVPHARGLLEVVLNFPPTASAEGAPEVAPNP